MTSEPIVVGGCYRWPFTATKDGNSFDLTGADITLSFFNHDNAIIKKYNFTGAAPTVYYDNPVDTFTIEGNWQYSWKVINGPFIEETKPRDFKVYKSLAALG